MRELFIQMVISMLAGGSMGLSAYNLIYSKNKNHGIFFSLTGVVSGSFLGSFALLLMSLIFEKLQSFPESYYSTTIGAMIFTVGMLKFINESIDRE